MKCVGNKVWLWQKFNFIYYSNNNIFNYHINHILSDFHLTLWKNMFFCRIWLYDLCHVICHMVSHMMCQMTITWCVKWTNRRTGGTCSIRLNSHSSCQVLNTLFYIHSITIKHRVREPRTGLRSELIIRAHLKSSNNLYVTKLSSCSLFQRNRVFSGFVIRLTASLIQF